MQSDFHYYATYCAAILAGFKHEDALGIAYSDQLVDLCSRTLLTKLSAPRSAATTQLAMEMANARTDPLGLQDITRIWASFHFLPFDLYAKKEKCTRRYRNKYRLICNCNGPLVKDTVELARGKGIQACGIAMHVLADTWAHRYFAGTPSLVINNTNSSFVELLPEGESFRERQISFRHNPSAPDDLERGIYINSIYQAGENAIMNLGHGRAGHLPDYSFIRYKYLPAWNDYEEIIKDNPSDYYYAFCQMVYALKCLRTGNIFEVNQYDFEAVDPLEKEIRSLLLCRRPDASEGWKILGERLSSVKIEDFDLEKYQTEYIMALKEDKDETFLGRFILAALSQKSMVTNKIFRSGNLLAGFSVDFEEKGFRGIRDYYKLVEEVRKGETV